MHLRGKSHEDAICRLGKGKTASTRNRNTRKSSTQMCPKDSSYKYTQGASAKGLDKTELQALQK